MQFYFSGIKVKYAYWAGTEKDEGGSRKYVTKKTNELEILKPQKFPEQLQWIVLTDLPGQP